MRYADNPPTRKDFERLFLLHPALLDKINDYCTSKSPEFQKFTKLDLLTIFDDFSVRTKNNPSKEYFLNSAKEMIILTFPELKPSLDEKYPAQNKTFN